MNPAFIVQNKVMLIGSYNIEKRDSNEESRFLNFIDFLSIKILWINSLP